MEEISDQDLKWGYWWEEHRARIKQILLIIVIVMVSMLVLYSSWQFIDWLASRKAENEMYKVMVDNQVNFDDWWQNNKPKDPELGQVYAVSAGAGVYDLVVSIKNPNLRWAIQDFDYVFDVDGETYTGSNFLLPMEDKYILSLAVKSSSQPRSLSVELVNLHWQRIKNLSEYTAPNFVVEDQDIQQVTVANKDIPANKLDFKLLNESPYGYRQIVVTAMLLSSGKIQSVGQQTINEIDSGQMVPVTFYWPQASGLIDNLFVRAEVNVLKSEFIKPL